MHRGRLSLALSALFACTTPADTATAAATGASTEPTRGDHEYIFTLHLNRDVDLLFVVDNSAATAD